MLTFVCTVLSLFNIFFLIFFGRGLGPWGPDMVRKYTSARFVTHTTGEMLTESESRLLTGMLTYIFSFPFFFGVLR